MIDHTTSLTPVYFVSLRVSHFVCLTKMAKTLTVPCSDVPFFIHLAFRYFMAWIYRKIYLRKKDTQKMKKYFLRSNMMFWLNFF